MREELAWLFRELQKMEDALWYQKQLDRELQEYRLNIANLWSDNASRELNSRYFNPHEEDSISMQKAFSTQRRHLERAYDNLQCGRKLMEEAAVASHKISLILERVQDQVDRAEREYEQFANCSSLGRHTLTVIDKFISASNSHCAPLCT